TQKPSAKSLCRLFQDAFCLRPCGGGLGEDPCLERKGGEADGGEEVVRIFSGEPCGIADEELGHHGDGREDEHENSRDGHEPDGQVPAPHPKEDDEERQAAEELVGCAEKRPEDEAAL